MKALRLLLILTSCSVFSPLALAAESKIFRAGAAQVDITPTTFPVINSGGFLERMADRAHDRLMSRALILDDGQTRIALAVVDNLAMTQEFLDDVKRQASQATGIPTDRMLISATHTHSAPSVMGALGSRADAAYTEFLPGRIVKSIVLAAEKLEPARVGWASVQDYAHNHCRRWVYRPDRMPSDPFGGRTVRAMMHPGYQSPHHVGPAGPADQGLTILSVQSPDGRPIAVLGNYALHYKGSPAVSGDFCGRFGDALASLIGVESDSPAFVGMMSQGTSGDSMWMDYAKPANDPGLEGYTLAVAKVAHEAYQQIVYQPWVPLATAESRLRLARRAPDEQRLAWAKEIAAKIQDRLPQNQPEVYALEALHLHERPEVEIVLQAVRIGDLGITALPNEVYGITGLKLKAQSPLKHTFNIELANGEFGYIPPPEQHFLGGYTTWPARTAGLQAEAEPKIVERLLSLLEQVSGQPRTLREPPADDYVRAVERSRPAAFWRLDELAGSIARDASGQNRPAEYELGVAFYLPGRSPHDLDYAEQTPNRGVHIAGGRIKAAAPDGNGAYSVEFWFWNGLPADARPVCGHLFAVGIEGDAGAAADQLQISGAATGDGVLRFANGLGVELTGQTPLRRRAWHHVALVRNGRQVAVFLNGRAEPEMAGEADLKTMLGARLFFGGRQDLDSTLEGKLDDIAVYTRALTADEIAAHYRASGLTPPRPVPPPKTAPIQAIRPYAPADLERYAAAIRESQPVAWWTLHESEQRQVPDASGHGCQAELEEGAEARRPDADAANFAGGRLKAALAGLPRDYSAELWIWNELPVNARPVTGYFFSRGEDRSAEAPGEHVGIGGTFTATGRLIVFNGNRGNETLAGTTLLPPRSWNHVVLVRQADTVRVYLNGAREPEIEGRLPPTFPDNGGQVFIGARNDRFAPLQGRIDQVAVYDRPLRPDEVAAHFAASCITGPGGESE
jgi:hypothetical protein